MSKVILVAEDDDDVREFAEMLIGHLGYDVVSAPDGVAALQVIEERSVDALLTDIRMPRMDGYELAARAHKLRPEMPIVCVTGFSHLSADGRHCQVFLRKPFAPRQLEEVLKQLVPS